MFREHVLKRAATYIILIASIQNDHLQKLTQNLIKIFTTSRQRMKLHIFKNFLEGIMSPINLRMCAVIMAIFMQNF